MAAVKPKTKAQEKADAAAKETAKAKVAAKKQAHAATLDKPDAEALAKATAADAAKPKAADEAPAPAKRIPASVPPETKVEGTEPKAGAGSLGALLARIENVEAKIVDLTEENGRIMKALRTGERFEKKGGTHVGSIDELGKIAE